jgi:subtilisin-like proprotein convertase family protein
MIENWKIRVMEEIATINEKKTEIEAYLGTNEYQTLDLVSQTLLDTQLNIMDSYGNILAARIRAGGGL